MTNVTRVGIGVALLRVSDKHITEVLLGERKGSHGAGEMALPGGHLEYGESFHDTAVRELIEELGPDVKFTKPQVTSVINLTDYMPKHYVDIGMVASYIEGEPRVMEPDKCESWQWVSVDEVLYGNVKVFATVPRILESWYSIGRISVYDS